MAFYVLLALLVIGLYFYAYINPHSDKTISVLLLIIMIIIGGLRDHVGWDYNSYIYWYHTGARDEGIEFGFLVLMKVFRYLNLDYTFLFFFFSFFTYLFAYLGIRKYTQKSTLPMVLYFLVPVLFLYSFTYIRQFLSVAIAFYAFSFLLEKKYWSYFLLMFLGVSFHYSCLIPFFVFLIVFKLGDFVSIRYLYVLMGISFIISQIGIIDLLSFFFKDSHYLFYVSNKFAAPVSLMKLLVLNGMCLSVIWFYKKYGFEYVHQKYFLLVYICSVIILNLFSESSELSRIYIYFRIFEIILVAEIIRFLLLHKKIWLVGIICIFYLGPYFRAIKIQAEIAPENLKMIPYKSLLFKNDL